MILRAKFHLEEPQDSAYRHSLLVAYEFQELLEVGVVNNRAEIAQRYGLSRARVTQTMRLPDLCRLRARSLPTVFGKDTF